LGFVGAALLTGSAAAQNQELVLPPTNAQVIAKSSSPVPTPLPASLDTGSISSPPSVRTGVPADAPYYPPNGAGISHLKPDNVAPPPASPPAQQAAPLAVQKIGPPMLYQGVATEYTISVRNQGATPLQGVRVEDDLPPGAKLLRTDPPAKEYQGKLTWIVDHLGRGEERHFKVNFEPREKGELLGGTTTASFAVTTSASAPVPAPAPAPAKIAPQALTLDIHGPETIAPGATAKFEIELVNAGVTPLTNLVILDDLPEGLEGPPGLDHPGDRKMQAVLGTMAPGEKKLLPLHLKSTGKPYCRNHILVRSNNRLLVERWQEIKLEEPVVVPPSVTEVPPPLPRDSAVTLPPAKAVIEADVTLPPVKAPVETASMHETSNPAGSGGEEPKGRPAQIVHEAPMHEAPMHEAPAAVMPSIKIDMSMGEEWTEIGADSIYTVHLFNANDAPALDIKLCAIVPEGVTFVSAEAPVRPHEDGHEIHFSALPELGPKCEMTYRIRVHGVKAGEWPFRVYVTCEKCEKQSCLERTVRVMEPQMRIEH
jgi:uncharacterized repeat protein (TIGR01451 family)